MSSQIFILPKYDLRFIARTPNKPAYISENISVYTLMIRVARANRNARSLIYPLSAVMGTMFLRLVGELRQTIGFG